MRLRWFKGRVRGILRDTLLVAALILFDPDVPWFCVGLGFFFIGSALHFWSKGCLARNDEVAPSGPYRLVRHPFYLANGLLDFAICFMSGQLALVCLYPPLFAFTYIPVILREEEYLSGAFPEAYPLYRTRVPALLPFRLPSPAGGAGFSWQNVVRENEIARLLRILVIPCYFVIIAICFHGVVPRATAMHVVVLGGAVVSAAFLHAAALYAKYRRRQMIQRFQAIEFSPAR